MTEPYSSSASAPEPQEKLARRPYTKPSIVRVELRAEEAVLGACKTASSNGPAQGLCSSPIACTSIAS
jgi:hypothetical protein